MADKCWEPALLSAPANKERSQFRIALGYQHGPRWQPRTQMFSIVFGGHMSPRTSIQTPAALWPQTQMWQHGSALQSGTVYSQQTLPLHPVSSSASLHSAQISQLLFLSSLHHTFEHHRGSRCWATQPVNLWVFLKPHGSVQPSQ